MKKNIFLLLTFLSFSIFSFGQDNTDKKETIIGNSLNNETIFIHYNSSFLLTGEKLYFKVYCLNTDTYRASNVSKIAYIKILDEKKQFVYSTKVTLNNGSGFGEYKIPLKLETGNYKLLGYTNWMKRNKTSPSFFQADLTIINPFIDNSNKISNNNSTKRKAENILDKESDILKITLNKHKYKSREKIQLKLSPLLKGKSYGNYSLSVKKIDSIPTKSRKNIFDIYPDIKHQTTYPINTFSSPDLHGETFKGKISSTNNVSLDNKKIFVSTSDDYSDFLISTTDKNGEFNFSLNKNLNEKINFQVLNEGNQKFKIEISPDDLTINDKILFEKLILTKDLEDKIIKRNVYNQINNSFKVVKTKIKEDENKGIFHRNVHKTYNLDDYSRFKTIKETLIEVVEDLSLKQNNKNYFFRMRKNNSNTLKYNYTPWVIIDGILIKNHNDIVDYPAKNIKTISLLKEKYLIGTEIVEGIVIIETFKNHFFKNNHLKYVDIKNFLRAQPTREYFFPNYDSSSNYSRIPDYRHQLIWEPNIKLNKPEINIDFFTSDNTGLFEISIEGVTFNGKPVSIRKTFEVK